MQFDRMIAFYKAIGDPTRMRIIALLREKPLHGQAIAGKLGLRPPTITHHIDKLREVSLIKEHRVKNTIYFSLQRSVLEVYAQALINLGKEGSSLLPEITSDDRLAILSHFFTADGKLKTLPAQRKKRMVIMSRLVEGLEPGRVYSEKEISDYLRAFHDDYATLRRELIIYQFMYRKNGQYELNPPELWGE